MQVLHLLLPPPNSVLPLPHTPTPELWIMETLAVDFHNQKSSERHHLEPKIFLQPLTAAICSLNTSTTTVAHH